MKIAGYLKTSLLDWPGKVASIIFTSDCNFRCPFCHNKTLVIGKDLDLIEEKALLNDLKKRKKWIDGLVITGGESTLNPDLEAFCAKVKKLQFAIKLDTNGSNPEMVDRLLKKSLVDFLAMDVKTCKANYPTLVGNKTCLPKVEKTLMLILKSGIDFELRTTLVPKIHQKEDILKVGTWLLTFFNRFKVDKQKRTWVWQNFVGRNCLKSSLNGQKGYSLKEVSKWKKEVEKRGLNIILRGWPE